MQEPTAGRETSSRAFSLRTEIRSGDIGWMVRMHGLLYGREFDFDTTFEAYVAGTMGELDRELSERERIWLAERDGRVIGTVAILERSPETAQLRWFLIEPEARGIGLGKTLMAEALAFCRECGYRTVILWTVSALTAAAHLYRAAGFERVEATPGRRWGVDLVDERYELTLV